MEEQIKEEALVKPEPVGFIANPIALTLDYALSSLTLGSIREIWGVVFPNVVEPEKKKKEKMREKIAMFILAGIVPNTPAPARKEARVLNFQPIIGLQVTYSIKSSHDAAIANVEKRVTELIEKYKPTLFVFGKASGATAYEAMYSRWRDNYSHREYYNMVLIYEELSNDYRFFKDRKKRARAVEESLFETFSGDASFDNSITDYTGSDPKNTTNRYFVYFAYGQNAT